MFARASVYFLGCTFRNRALGMLRKLRSLTGEYVVPEGACNTWRALWVGLETLERDLHEHIHLENNILHKRAFRG